MSIAADAEIHPTAVIEDGAVIGAGSKVGPYCVIGHDVTIGQRVTLRSHVTVSGWTEIGEETIIFPFASIGDFPQDLKYAGERSRLIVGARNRIRETVTMNTGTQGGGGVTRVGDNGLFMAGVHIGHDCQVGDNVIMANNATLAGHVSVADFAFVGGLSAVHQFVRIGAYAMIGGMTGVTQDMIPFSMAVGNRASLSGLNIVGLRRRGFDREAIQALRRAYDMLFYGEGVMADRVPQVADAFSGVEPVQQIVRFVLEDTSRSFMIPADTGKKSEAPADA